MAIGGLPVQSEAAVDIPSAGTAVQLTSADNHKNLNSVVVSAPSGNSGNVYVGDSGVSSTNFIAELSPGQMVNIDPGRSREIDATTIYVDAATNGDDVVWGFF